MKFNGILTLVVTVLAVVLISSACIIPVVQSTQEKQYSTDNNTNELFVIAADSVASATNPIVLEISEDGYWVINGVTDTQAYLANNEKAWAENVGVRVTTNAQDQYVIQCTVWTTATNYTTYAVSSLVYDGSVLTGYSGPDTVSFTADSDLFIYPYSKGTYGQFDCRTATVRDNLHINNEAVVYMGVGSGYGFMVGNKAGFETIGYTGSATYDTRSLNYTATESDDGLTWSFASTPTTVLSDSTETEESTTTNWLYIYAPIEYKYISDNDSVIIAMLSIIPVLILLVPIMLVVRSFAVGRD